MSWAKISHTRPYSGNKSHSGANYEQNVNYPGPFLLFIMIRNRLS